MGGSPPQQQPKEREKKVKLSDILDTSSRLAALKEESERIRETVKADTPTLDALCQAVNTWGEMRKRDALKVEATGAQWDFTPHNAGAYLEATVYVVVTRDAAQHRGHLTVRIVAVRDGETVTASEWETNDGRTISYSAWVSYAPLPEVARKIIDAKLNATWAEIAPPTPVVWNEAVTYDIANAVRSNTPHAVDSLSRQLVGGVS